MAAGFTACDSEHNAVLNTENLTMTLNEPSFAQSAWQLEEGKTFELVATQPNYGYDAPATYSLEVSLTEDFEAFEVMTPADAGKPVMEFGENDLAIALNKLFGFDANTYADQGLIPVYMRAATELPGVEGTYTTSNVIECKEVGFYYAADKPGFIYLVGNPTGWKDPLMENAEFYEAYKLNETGAGTGVFVGSFELDPGMYFRFYKTLSGWGEDNELPSLGSQGVDGQNTEIVFDGDTFEGDLVPGKGGWFTGASFVPGTSVFMTVNLNTMTVTFKMGAIDYSAYPCIYLVGAPSGWKDPLEKNKDHYENFKLYDLKGDHVYTTVEPVALGAGNEWRFYTELTGWGSDNELPSIGALGTDFTKEDIDLTDGVYTGPAVPGKGNWCIGSACTVNMTLDMSDPDNMTITLTEVVE